MTITLENIVVLIFVALAAIYMVLRLRRVAAGRSQCVCGSKACASASQPCGGNASADAPDCGLPVIPSSCSQGGCEKNRK